MKMLLGRGVRVVSDRIKVAVDGSEGAQIGGRVTGNEMKFLNPNGESMINTGRILPNLVFIVCL